MQPFSEMYPAFFNYRSDALLIFSAIFLIQLSSSVIGRAVRVGFV